MIDPILTTLDSGFCGRFRNTREERSSTQACPSRKGKTFQSLLADHSMAYRLQLYVPTQLLWGASNSCVKLSILDLYTRIFPKPAFRRMCYITMALTICYFLSVFLETFLMCRPFAYSWDRTVPGGSCANTNLAYLFSGITNLLIDALVVTLPMPMLWGLHLPISKRIGLAGMFGFGYM